MIYSQIMYIKYKVRVFDIDSEFALSGSPPQPYIDFGIRTESTSDFHDILINELQRIIIDQGILSADKAIVKILVSRSGCSVPLCTYFFLQVLHSLDASHRPFWTHPTTSPPLLGTN